MDFKTVVHAVEDVAPTIAEMLGGPMAGTAVKLVANLFGADPANTDDILGKLTADADREVKLKTLEEELSQFKLSVGASDTENAREANIEEEKLGIKDNMPKIITLFLMGSFVIIIVLLMTQTISIVNSPLVGSMVGMLAREFIQACRYYIGGDGDKS